MIDKYTEDCLMAAVESEYDSCVTKHGNFKNKHEGYSVLLEEVQEVKEASISFVKTADIAMGYLWLMVRKDETDGIQDHIEEINDIAEELAKECIQVLAMCRKWKDLIAKENE